MQLISSNIWVWITERVIGLETEKYKVKLDTMTSFGEMIQLELKQYVVANLTRSKQLTA